MQANMTATLSKTFIDTVPNALAAPWVVGRGTSPLRPFLVYCGEFDVIAVEAWDQHGLQKVAALVQLHNSMIAADVDVNGVRHALTMLPRGPWVRSERTGATAVSAPRSTVIERTGGVGVAICDYLIDLHTRAHEMLAALDVVKRAAKAPGAVASNASA
jgi:hypothetical protein